MQLRAGTSGFSYSEWKGAFYPADLKNAQMLSFYGSRLSCVEINNTFYRLPRVDVVAAWGEQVPSGFRFAVKASRRITHEQRLKNAAESVSYLIKVAAILGDKLGPILFQLPPNLKRDVALLREFLTVLPDTCRPAVEFRHESWFEDDVYAALQDRGAALCIGDVDDPAKSSPLVATANWGYLRLRREDYSAQALASWAERIAAQPWQEAYAFFKHEVKGPLLAGELGRIFEGKPAGVIKVKPEPRQQRRVRKSAG
jgi:uncharacterized protein YecE (DUF72 family)